MHAHGRVAGQRRHGAGAWAAAVLGEGGAGYCFITGAVAEGGEWAFVRPMAIPFPDEQVTCAHRLAEAGVDIVPGHSSH